MTLVVDDGGDFRVVVWMALSTISVNLLPQQWRYSSLTLSHKNSIYHKLHSLFFVCILLCCGYISLEDISKIHHYLNPTKLNKRWNENINIFMNFSSLVVMKVVMLTTSDAANDETFHFSEALKGAVSYGTFKIVDFEKVWHIKVTVIPQDLMLFSKLCFCIWFENLHFCWKKIWFTNSSALPNI